LGKILTQLQATTTQDKNKADLKEVKIQAKKEKYKKKKGLRLLPSPQT
jgi:hypothetical protein